MSIFQPQIIQFSSSPVKYLDSPRSSKNSSRRKERKSRRNGLRASKRELAGEHNKILKAKPIQDFTRNSLLSNVVEIKPQHIPNQNDWYQRMNEISDTY